MVLLAHVEPDRRQAVGPQLAAQLLGGQPETDPVGLGPRVHEAKVHVVVEDGRARPERHHASRVGEGVVAVVMPLHHPHAGVQHHPVQQVGELAQAAADIGRHRAVHQHQAGEIAPAGARPAHAPPEGELLPGPEHPAVQVGDRQAEVLDLVALERHVDVAETSHEPRSVAHDAMRGVRLRVEPRVAPVTDEPVGLPVEPVGRHRDAVEEGIPLAQQPGGGPHARLTPNPGTTVP
jgi:hypothetical protein